MIISLVSKCIMKMDILGSWHEPRIGFLASDTRGTTVEKGKWKALVSVGFMASPHRRITAKTSGVLQQGHAIYSGELYTFCKIVPGMLLGPGGDKVPDHRSSGYAAARAALHELGSFRSR